MTAAPSPKPAPSTPVTPTADALLFAGREWRQHEFAVCMGFDAMRLCMGQKPKTFTRKEVLTWIKVMP